MPQIWLAGPQAWLSGPQAWLAGMLAGWLGNTKNGKYTHSTGLRPLSGPLPDDRWKELFRGYEMRQTVIFYLSWFSSYSLSKVHSELFTLIDLAELLIFNKNWSLVRQ